MRSAAWSTSSCAKNYRGARFTANVGESDHNDGDQSGYSFTFGQTSDKGSIMGGIEYNKQDGVEAGSRSFSKNAVSSLWHQWHRSERAESGDCPRRWIVVFTLRPYPGHWYARAGTFWLQLRGA